jgi:hypothetical protein
MDWGAAQSIPLAKWTAIKERRNGPCSPNKETSMASHKSQRKGSFLDADGGPFCVPIDISRRKAIRQVCGSSGDVRISSSSPAMTMTGVATASLSETYLAGLTRSHDIKKNTSRLSP